MESFATTFYFKEIIKDYEVFKEFIQQYTLLNAEEDSAMHIFCFQFIFNRYAKSNICYDRQDDFLCEFGITYQNEFIKYKKRKEYITAMYDLTASDIVEVEKMISTYAETPATEVVNPLDVMTSYINKQQGSKKTQNKLIAYRDALLKLSDEYIEEFLNCFKKHFLTMYGNSRYLY